MNKMLFANKIRTLREQNGLLQRKIATDLEKAYELGKRLVEKANADISRRK